MHYFQHCLTMLISLFTCFLLLSSTIDQKLISAHFPIQPLNLLPSIVANSLFLPTLSRDMEVLQFSPSFYVGKDEAGNVQNIYDLNSEFYNLGCNVANRLQSGYFGYNFLDFGQPWKENNILGVRILDREVGPTFLPLTSANGPSVEKTVQGYIDGIINCSREKSFRLITAVGINNGGGLSNDARLALNTEHGEAWRDMIIRLRGYSNNSRISLGVGMDVELDWSSPAKVYAWASPIKDADLRMIMFPTCEGCPYYAHPDWDPNGDWTTDTVYGLVRDFPSMPQLYAIDGIHAAQWNYMTVTWPQTKTPSPLAEVYLLGTLTQWDACTWTTYSWEMCELEFSYNKPAEAWKQIAGIQSPYLHHHQTDISSDDCVNDYCDWTQLPPP
jgi:hypothetical protein